jgi:16S rRNA processing protein RimM
MIRKEDNLLLGTITRSHGTKGSVLLRLRNIKPEDIKKRESVFVDVDGLLVPFFIDEFKTATNDSVILKFGNIDSETEARSFAGSEVFISPHQIKISRKSKAEINSLKGYTVIDKKLGFIGKAGEMAGISNNPLIEIVHGGGKWLLPFHEDIILEINVQKREILIEAPEGLFEI